MARDLICLRHICLSIRPTRLHILYLIRSSRSSNYKDSVHSFPYTKCIQTASITLAGKKGVKVSAPMPFGSLVSFMVNDIVGLKLDRFYKMQMGVLYELDNTAEVVW